MPQHGIDDDGVGLCASYQQMHIGLVIATGLANELSSLIAIGVQTIARVLVKIDFGQAPKDGRVGTLHIVACK